MLAELVAMVIVNAYLVAALLTVMKLYYKAKKGLHDSEVKCEEWSRSYYSIVRDNASQASCILRLNEEVRRLTKENEAD